MLAKQRELLPNYYQRLLRMRVGVRDIFSIKVDFRVATAALQYCFSNPGWPSRFICRVSGPKTSRRQNLKNWWTEHEDSRFITVPNLGHCKTKNALRWWGVRTSPWVSTSSPPDSYSPTWVEISDQVPAAPHAKTPTASQGLGCYQIRSYIWHHTM